MICYAIMVRLPSDPERNHKSGTRKRTLMETERERTEPKS
jgi:hypothetical protein